MKKTLTASLAAVVARAAVLDLPVVIDDTYASVVLNAGTPPKAYRLEFDTGSASTWMTSNLCTPASCPNPRPFNRTLYAANESSTSVDLGVYDLTPFIDGEIVSGPAKQDVFSVPGTGLQWNQTFMAVNRSDWPWITADGLLGLAFSANAEEKTTPLVETLLWSGELDEPRFGLYYGTNNNSTGVHNGVLTIGGSKEETYAKEEVVSVPLKEEDPRSVWRTALRSINLLVTRGANGTVIPVTGSLPKSLDPAGTFPSANVTWLEGQSSSVVFDTGSGLMMLPSDMIDAVYFNLGWNLTKLLSGEERMGCSAMNSSWAITFTLGEKDEADDRSFSLRGDEIVAPGEQCMPPFTGSGTNGFLLAGQPFLRRWYSVFDYGADQAAAYAPRIGFGRLKSEWDYAPKF